MGTSATTMALCFRAMSRMSQVLWTSAFASMHDATTLTAQPNVTAQPRLSFFLFSSCDVLEMCWKWKTLTQPRKIDKTKNTTSSKEIRKFSCRWYIFYEKIKWMRPTRCPLNSQRICSVRWINSSQVIGRMNLQRKITVPKMVTFIPSAREKWVVGAGTIIRPLYTVQVHTYTYAIYIVEIES